MAAEGAYTRLEERFARLSHIERALGLLDWDNSVMMPPGGARDRADQVATLTALHHDMLTAAEVGTWIDAAEGEELSPWQRANLIEMRRHRLHAAAVPTALAEALSRASMACEMAWRTARPTNDFAAVAPLLEDVLRLTRETARVKSQALDVSLYDALLDKYEPQGRSAAIDVIFDDLGAFLPGFLDAVLGRQVERPTGPQGPFPVDQQKALGVRMMAALGFDFDRGRLDVSHHPFCGGPGGGDVRITTRYNEADFMTSLMGVLHETGHALYEMGLPAEWRDQPVGRARSMGLHESQSLLIEKQIGRSRAFVDFAAPLMAEAFAAEGKAGWDADSLHAVTTWVQPGFIRVDADEVTYPAHVILRYRLEKGLITGALEVEDIPAAWNEAMVELLGLNPPEDRLGCLQDVHWYGGLFGYFPTYTLGAMTAAQLFAAAAWAIPELRENIAQGDFGPLLRWLRMNVHEHGSALSTDDLLINATSQRLDAAVFKDHLTRRYLP